MWGKRAKIDKADTLFSIYIRHRDGECVCCHRKGEPNKDGYNILGLQNSHYWGRGHEGIRFEPDNCIALCAYHHNIWGHGDEKDLYTKFMIKKLGNDRFKSLDVQAHTYCKKDRKLAYLSVKVLLDKLKTEI